MKNIFKMLASGALCLCLSIFCIGCTPTTPNENNKPNGDQTENDNNQTETPDKDPDEGKEEVPVKVSGLPYATTLAVQLSTLKSFSAECSMEQVTIDASGNSLSYLYGISAKVNVKESGIDFAATLKTEVAMTGTDSEPISATDEETVYLIDGVFYQYSEDFGQYIGTDFSNSELAEYVMAAIEYIMQSSDLPIGSIEQLDDAIAALKLYMQTQLPVSLMPIISDKATAYKGTTTLKETVDFKSDIQDVLSTINGIDESETTVAEALNTYILPYVGEDVTTDDLIDMLVSLSQLTTAEAVDAINGMLEAQGTSLQQIWSEIFVEGSEYEEIFADLGLEDVFALLCSTSLDEILQSELPAKTGNDESGVEGSGESGAGESGEEQPAKTVGESTVYEVLLYLFGGDEAEELTEEELSAMLKEMANSVTLADLGITLPELDDAEVLVAESYYTMEFTTATYLLNSANCGAKIELTNLSTDVKKFILSCSAELFELSDSYVLIVPPAGSSVLIGE